MSLNSFCDLLKPVHRRRIYIEGKAKVSLIFGGKWPPAKIVCSRQIDKGGPGRASKTVSCRVGYILLGSERIALLRSFKACNILLRPFFKFLATYETQKNVAFFCVLFLRT